VTAKLDIQKRNGLSY